MAFDFSKATSAAVKSIKTTSAKLGLVALGQSGAGKSRLAGTFGVPTLYLYGSGEAHGAISASRKQDGTLIPVCWDTDDDGNELKTADAKYKRLLSALTAVDEIKEAGIGAVIIDGATELEALIRSTNQWDTLTLSPKGKHDGFAEGPVTKQMFRAVTNALRNLQVQADVHYVMTCILDVRLIGEDGSIDEASPRLTGYSVAEDLIQQFGDVVAIGRMVKDDKVAHRIQFLAGISKTSKDENKQVKKTINFTPRLGDYDATELPATFPADLAALAKLKARSK